MSLSVSNWSKEAEWCVCVCECYQNWAVLYKEAEWCVCVCVCVCVCCKIIAVYCMWMVWLAMCHKDMHSSCCNSKFYIKKKKKKKKIYVLIFWFTNFYKSSTVYWLPRMMWWRSQTLAPAVSGMKKAPRCLLLAPCPGWHQRSSGMSHAMKK